MSKTARIELRVDPEVQARITKAAQLVSQSNTTFILTAAAERADEVVANWSSTAVSPDFFDELQAALARPPVRNDAMTKAFERRRVSLIPEVA